MDFDRPLALGRTAKIYAWKDGWVLKVYEDWFGRGDIEYEARLAAAIHASGLAVPAVGQIIEVDGRLGLEYERVDGQEMLDQIRGRPLSMIHLARRLAELHAQLHSIQIDGIPAQRERLERKIRGSEHLAPEPKGAALAALSRLPDSSALCHGDFHPKNILVTPNREVVIDWIDATRGNPLADLARSSVIYLGEAARLGWRGLPLRFLNAIYLRRYFQVRPGRREEFKAWFPTVAAARTSENIEPINAWLVQQAGELLKQDEGHLRS
jgi:uncharacterized protein (TIGR02172 family)